MEPVIGTIKMEPKDQFSFVSKQLNGLTTYMGRSDGSYVIEHVQCSSHHK
jgi:hypothetical protein